MGCYCVMGGNRAEREQQVFKINSKMELSNLLKRLAGGVAKYRAWDFIQVLIKSQNGKFRIWQEFV